eukprot:6224119-Prymnesium_polylepis.1
MATTAEAEQVTARAVGLSLWRGGMCMSRTSVFDHASRILCCARERRVPCVCYSHTCSGAGGSESGERQTRVHAESGESCKDSDVLVVGCGFSRFSDLCGMLASRSRFDP